MADKYIGNFFFSDPHSKFVNQKDKLQSISENRDVALGTMGENDKYLAMAISMPGQLKDDVFQRCSDDKEVACVKTDYEKMDPRNIFAYATVLKNKFNYNKVANPNKQSFYVADNASSFREITKDEFYKT